MARKALVDVVADDLLDRIVRGEFEVGGFLPAEAEMAVRYDVSRVTVREALRSLTSQGIVSVRSGKSTEVNPVAQWQPLDAIVGFHEVHSDRGEIAVHLVEMRRVFETAACAMASGRITAEELDEVAGQLALMESANDVGDVEAFVMADIRFHDVILEAAGNVFLPLIFGPLRRIFVERRRETSSVPQIRTNAIAQHRRILEALREGTPESARRAMDGHMAQTLDDLKHYVLGQEASER